jgi:DNA-binding GntR family transcriptional regulator
MHRIQAAKGSASRITSVASRSPSKAKPVPTAAKENQGERAYRKLKRLILDNELSANAQLLELDAAAQLKMSRTPIREAMIRLQQEGMVEIKPRHGMRVLPVSPDDMREIYEVLTGLEGTAAWSVANRGLSKDELGLLRACIKNMDIALEKDDLKAWAAADEQFHSLLITFSGNSRLINMVTQLSDQAHRARVLTLRLRPKPIASNRDHEALVEAIAAKAPEKARRIHFEHRSRAGKMLIDVLNRFGLGKL